jgi:predicted lipoprotein with Yx(FWY)xxD motif
VLCGIAATAVGAAKPEPPWSPAEVSVFENKGVYSFANDYGIPFYTNDQDKSGKIGCGDDCTDDTWIPVFARAAAKPQGDWSIVVRPDKATQWAYKGKPVYNFFVSHDPAEAAALIQPMPHWHKLEP